MQITKQNIDAKHALGLDEGVKGHPCIQPDRNNNSRLWNSYKAGWWKGMKAYITVNKNTIFDLYDKDAVYGEARARHIFSEAGMCNRQVNLVIGKFNAAVKNANRELDLG